jgi:hypothetical protein
MDGKNIVNFVLLFEWLKIRHSLICLSHLSEKKLVKHLKKNFFFGSRDPMHQNFYYAKTDHRADSINLQRKFWKIDQYWNEIKRNLSSI